MRELSRLRGSERYGACDDESQGLYYSTFFEKEAFL